MTGAFSIDSLYIKPQWNNSAKSPKNAAEPFVIFKPKEKIADVKPLTSTNLAVITAEKLIAQDINEGNNSYKKLTQGRTEQWCADTVNYIYEEAYGKNPFGVHKDGSYKSSVLELKQWGIKNKRFKPAQCETEIQAQIPEMKSGDIIIWKSPYKIKTAEGKEIIKNASHTGIIKEIQDGTVSIIEGNANIAKKNEQGEFFIVKNKKEGSNGDQEIGEFQELNRFDSLMIKKYSTKDLISSGYSGYIDMQNLD